MSRRSWSLVAVALSGLVSLVAVSAPTPAATAAVSVPGLISRPAVIGGHDATPGAWPAVVAIGYADRSAPRGFYCGATLVAPTWVLTAAHCMAGERARDVVVHAGLTVLSAPGGTTIAVRRIVRANWIKRVERNDITLLELARPATQAPMALATSQGVYSAGSRATILGWGSSKPSGKGFRDHLQEGTVRTVSGALCRWTWGDIDTRRQVCAGTSRRAVPVDSCSGDSGGPLIVRDPAGQPLLAGVVSFGGQRCGLRRQPAVYTKTVGYLSWIRQITESG